jgi:hypothetical protein
MWLGWRHEESPCRLAVVAVVRCSALRPAFCDPLIAPRHPPLLVRWRRLAAVRRASAWPSLRVRWPWCWAGDEGRAAWWWRWRRRWWKRTAALSWRRVPSSWFRWRWGRIASGHVPSRRSRRRVAVSVPARLEVVEGFRLGRARVVEGGGGGGCLSAWPAEVGIAGRSP